MVKVTRDKPDAEAEKIVHFTVYLSPKDKKTVLGVSDAGYQSGPQEVTLYGSPFGVPVQEAFDKALAYAKSRGFPYLWVDDPDDLFVPQGRAGGP